MFFKKYNNEYISTIREKIKNGDITIYSPLIKNKIKEIAAYEATHPDEPPKEYLSDLAKVQIFMDSYSNRTKNALLRDLFKEQLFATYEFFKDNNLPMNKFEDIFNRGKFINFIGVKTDKSWFTIFGHFDDKANGKTISFPYKLIAINPFSPEINILNYNSSLNQTGAHETIHFVNPKGTYPNISSNYIQSQSNFNDLCTEVYSTKIAQEYLDNNIKSKTLSRTFLHSNKEMTFITDTKDYCEETVFFDAFNYISGNKLALICFDSNLNINNIGNTNIVQGILDFCDKYNEIYDKNDKTKLLEQNFDAMIDSFSSLAEKYVRNLGLNKSTTPESLEGAITFKKVEEFFNTFDSITFQKDGENFTQKDLIKEKILGAIYYNDKSSEEAINRLNNERTFVKEFEENCNTAMKTIEKSKTSESEITTSIEKTKENETTKDNSKSDDLEI